MMMMTEMMVMMIMIKMMWSHSGCQRQQDFLTSPPTSSLLLLQTHFNLLFSQSLCVFAAISLARSDGACSLTHCQRHGIRLPSSTVNRPGGVSGVRVARLFEQSGCRSDDVLPCLQGPLSLSHAPFPPTPISPRFLPLLSVWVAA